MTRKIVFSVVLLSIMYYLMLMLITPYANYLIKIPEWWYPTFGHGNVQALTWLHLVNALFVLACALPISVIIIRVFPSRWVMVALGTGVLATTYVFTPTLRLLISESVTASDQSRLFSLSLLVDVVKYAIFPLIICALIRKAMRFNGPPHLRTE